MVNRGKPSLACGRCRARRLKCDQATPSCSQCLRARVDCPGYRDPMSLVFRNQNEQVIRNAEKSRTTTTVSMNKSHAGSNTGPSATRLPTHSPAFSVNEQANCFFRRNYASEFTFLDIPHTEATSAVSLAVAALGLAALANVKMAPSIMMEARKEYTMALSYTNYAIGDSVLSKSDSTLAAVIALGMFEAMTWDGTSSLRRWKHHIGGATKLIEWQGESLLQTQRGVEMFSYLRNQIVITNMHGKYHVPPTLEQLSREAYRFSEGDLKYANQLSILSFRLCDLCASVHHQHLTDPIAIISAAVALDSKLVSWASTLPASWTPTPVRTPGGGMGREHGAYGDRYHIYNGLIASHAWNNYRLARYTAHERIIGQLHKLPEQGILLRSECAELAGKSKTIMNEIVEDICASVPYHIGAITRPSASQVHPEGSDHPAAAGYSLTWYLFLASSSQFAPPDLKRWALMRLENIGHAMGISQALVMASKSRAGLDPWSTERWPR